MEYAEDCMEPERSGIRLRGPNFLRVNQLSAELCEILYRKWRGIKPTVVGIISIWYIHVYIYIHTHRAGRIFRSLLVRFCDRFSQFQKHKNHLKPFPWWPWLAMALVSNHPYIWRRFRTKESSSLTLAAAFLSLIMTSPTPLKTVPFILLQLLACFIIQLPTSQLTWSSHIF